jgi:hypothetical protein
MRNIIDTLCPKVPLKPKRKNSQTFQGRFPAIPCLFELLVHHNADIPVGKFRGIPAREARGRKTSELAGSIAGSANISQMRSRRFDPIAAGRQKFALGPLPRPGWMLPLVP